jgi:DNA-binding transcriptional LysR family regulator
MNNIKMLPALLTFAEVAKQQSFTRAAEHLGMSKSAVSQQVKRLEEQIGQQLLSRHTRGMSLTSVGQTLLARCELLGDQVNLAFEAIDASRETPSGPFAITLPHACEHEIVMPALKQLCVEFPLLEPRILVSDEPQDLIEAKLDVAIYAGDLPDSAYRALPIGNAQEILCASPAYIKNQQQGSINKLEDLQRLRWIAAPWQKDDLTLFDAQQPTQKIKLPVTFSAHSNTLPSALALVSFDMGAMLLPVFVLQEGLAKGRLQQLLPSHTGRQWPFYMVHRFQGDKPEHVSRFHQLLTHYFAKASA